MDSSNSRIAIAIPTLTCETEDESVGEVIVEGEFDVVLPEAKGTAGSHQGSKDPVEDDDLEDDEKS